MAVLTPAAGAEGVHDARGEALRLYDAGRFEEALPHFDVVLAKKPHDIESRNKRGVILLPMNQPERAWPTSRRRGDTARSWVTTRSACSSSSRPTCRSRSTRRCWPAARFTRRP
ncbi:MAG: hypothetical protein U0835_25725 [Isosphaeraceae bacterium]